MKCKICNQEVKPKGKGVHMAMHRRRGDEEPSVAQHPVVEDKDIPKWRRRTPVFGPGQAGVRIPAGRLRRGIKQLT